MAEFYLLKGHTINTFTQQWIIFGHVISGLATLELLISSQTIAIVVIVKHVNVQHHTKLFNFFNCGQLKLK